ncbi:hypothetical protein L7F22_019799 [Adiantum nelumboides]|nr:hypothetical protein [Adiantum nelumboides]
MPSHPFSSIPSSSFLQFGKMGLQDDPQSTHAEILPDSICLTGLSVRMLVGVDNWERVKPQPVKIDVQIHTDVSKAGNADHLPHSIHYGVLTKELESHCSGERYRSLEALAEGLAKVCIFTCRAPKVTLRVQKPRSLLHAESAGVQIIRTASDFVTTDGKDAEEVYAPQSKVSIAASAEEQASLRLSGSSYWAQHDRVFVKDLCISTILGVNPWERVDKQIVRINLEVYSGLERLRQAALIGSSKAAVPTPTVDMVTKPQNYRTIVRSISDHVQRSNYKTVESLALSIAEVAVRQNRVERIRVRVDKPSAIMFAECAGVEVERDRAYFESVNEEDETKSITTPASMSASFTAKATDAAHTKVNGLDHDWHVAAIALGSNVGDRFANIERAVALLGASKDCKLVDTSFLYETEPKYYIDQPKFINGACRIATKLDPHSLLKLCQSIEKEIGRDKSGVPIKGPRAIDLDILLYDRIELNTTDLIVPHAGITEREFVLKPLMDILPDYRHPSTSRTISQLHSILINSEGYVQEDMKRVLPLQLGKKEKIAWSWGKKTYVMGIINATPDSFSDGGDNVNVLNAVATSKAMIEEGVDILDIGGMSTAPNAREIDEQEEIQRVVPVIKGIRSLYGEIPISIDTFRASVAEAALEAGATMINDVTAGVRDPAIFEVARTFECPIILMHMRGDSSTMNSLVQYAKNDVVQAVSKELESRIESALRQRVPRWNIILDPGIGFAKNADGNLQLLRGLARIRNGGGNGSVSQSRTDSPPPLNAIEKEPSPASLEPNLSLKAFPLLVGPSRKRFLGTITGRSVAKDRMAGTAAACTAAILAGADIIRVHDVKEMIDVAKTADAIARGGEEQ